MAIYSPVTGGTQVKILHKIPTRTIVDLYHKNIGIDVSGYFNQIEDVLIAECSDTGFRFYYPQNIFADGAFYAALNKKMPSYYNPKRWEHLRALRLLNAHDNVLEVGSGSGAFLKMFAKKGGKITGLEINAEAIASSTKEGATVLPETLETHALSHGECYDAVVSFQVLEHIYDVKSYFENALKCLRPGGKLIIGVPNNNPFIFRHNMLDTLNLPPHHSGLWSVAAFKKIPQFFGLRPDQVLVEPLQETKEWYRAQQRFFRQNGSPAKAFAMGLVPRFVYKRALKMFNRFIDGRNLLACFIKV